MDTIRIWHVLRNGGTDKQRVESLKDLELLEKKNEQLQQRVKELEKGIEIFLTKYQRTKTIHIGHPIEVSDSQFLYKKDLDKLKLLIPKEG